MRRGLRMLVMSLALALTSACATGVSAQVSPGPLAAPHASLDNGTQCFQCHAKAGAKAGMDARCLACHREIALLRDQKRGLHPTVAAKDCASCHPDHGGRDFQMIAWDGGSPEKFDHARAGYTLQGKHASLACRDCHKPALQKSAAVALMKRKDHARSFLGLERECASCHTDPHHGQLGDRCVTCHDQKAWKPALGFDHSKTSFALTGAHIKVECAKCHAAIPGALDAKGQPMRQWKPVAHNDCVNCHKDPHAGRFPGTCAKCHTSTADFHTLRSSGFNHDLTRYPLRGQHAAVLCAKCHDARTAFGPKPKFAQCGDCHRDAHNGLATLAGKAADCASCHDVSGFDHPTYTATAHQASAYPLEGRHASAACTSCHAKGAATAAVVAAFGSSRIDMRPKHDACTSCHGDPHAGRFEPAGARARAKRCLECHSMAAFRPSSFDLNAHHTASFALEGAHRAVPCQTCHRELEAAPSRGSLLAAAAGMRPLRFEDRSRACADCHRDPHDGQFAARKDKGACEGCHDVNAFAPASGFSHDRDAHYKLEGAHRRAACIACHTPQRTSDGRSVVRYHPTPTRCEDCHANGVPAGDVNKSSNIRGASAAPLADRPHPEAAHGHRS
jgi:hypothetical protein